MKHLKCGGMLVKIVDTIFKAVYQCDTCGKILTLYRRLPPVAASKED